MDVTTLNCPACNKATLERRSGDPVLYDLGTSHPHTCGITLPSTGDDLLTRVTAIDPSKRQAYLRNFGRKLLREAADLCGVDAETMTARQCIAAISANF